MKWLLSDISDYFKIKQNGFTVYHIVIKIVIVFYFALFVTKILIRWKESEVIEVLKMLGYVKRLRAKKHTYQDSQS